MATSHRGAVTFSRSTGPHHSSQDVSNTSTADAARTGITMPFVTLLAESVNSVYFTPDRYIRPTTSGGYNEPIRNPLPGLGTWRMVWTFPALLPGRPVLGRVLDAHE